MTATFKRFLSVLLALCVAASVCVTGAAAWATSGSAEGASAAGGGGAVGGASDDATPQATAYMSVYVRNSSTDSYGAAAKTFTQDEFEALATTGTAAAYQASKSGLFTVYASDEYVQLTDLFGAAGVSIESDDTITVGTSDDYSNVPTFTWAQAIAGQWYPNATPGSYVTSGAVAVPPAIAITCGSSPVGSNTSEGAASIALQGASTDECPRLLLGVPASDFENGSGMLADRLVKYVNRIYITKASAPTPTSSTVEVYEKTGANGTEALVKTYTAEQLSGMAVAGSLNYQYMSKGRWNVANVGSYITLASLFANAGVKVASTDTVIVQEYSTEGSYGGSWEYAALAAGRFYPDSAFSTPYITSNAEDVPAVLALSYGDAQLSTTADVAAASAAAQQSSKSCPRLFWGIAQSDFTAAGVTGGSAAGSRLVKNVNRIVVQHNEVAPTPTPDPDPDPQPTPDPDPQPTPTPDPDPDPTPTPDPDPQPTPDPDPDPTPSPDPDPDPAPDPDPDPTPDPDPDPDPDPVVADSVERIAGEQAADTAVAVSKAAFESASTVVVATENGFADAMSATGLAGAKDAPILLTAKDELTEATKAEVERLQAREVLLIGGEAVVSAAVEEELTALVGKAGSVQRIAGAEAEDTSVLCAQVLAGLGGQSSMAIVASSYTFQDALSVSTFAYKYQVPILLQTGGSEISADRALTSDGVALLTSGYYKEAALYVPGGFGAVSYESCEAALGARVYVRMAGETAYDTSNEIAECLVSKGLLSADGLVVACGAQAAGGTDALAAAALGGKAGSALVLVNGNGAMEAVDTTAIDGFVSAHAASISHVYALGGSYVMPAGVISKVDALITMGKE